MAENEIVRQNHLLSGHEFEQTLGNSEEQRSLAGYSPQGRKELDMTEMNQHSTTQHTTKI